ncbi:MAG: hypothetical protein IJT24_07505, partial [Lachnospiraceae bacterium]|nr:hypothetical protein [Lachnospiraceae bacterium]
ELTGNDTYIRSDDALKVSQSITLEEKPLPAGEYGYAFVLTDLLGRRIETDRVSFTWDGEKAEFTLTE